MDRPVAGAVADEISDILRHYGIKGMKWGVRKSDDQPKPESRSVTLKNGDKITLDGRPSPLMFRLVDRLNPYIDAKTFERQHFHIKDKDGNRVGETYLYSESKDDLHVAWIGVKDEFRGNGYASAVMKSTIEQAKQKGYKKVTLQAITESKDAVHIYKKLGFKEDENQDDAWEGLTDMTLKLQHGENLDDILAHYGIKGMKWGVRRDNPSAQPASSDYETATAAKAKVKAGGVKSLSNDELKTYLERMDLEKRYKKGNPSAKDEVTKFIKDTLLQVGKQEAAKYVGKQVAKALAGR